MSKSYKELEKFSADSMQSADNYNYEYKKDQNYIQLKKEMRKGEDLCDLNIANESYNKFKSNLDIHRTKIKNEQQKLVRQGKITLTSPFLYSPAKNKDEVKEEKEKEVGQPSKKEKEVG